MPRPATGASRRRPETIFSGNSAPPTVKKLYRGHEELQADLDAWLREYNEARPHQGRWCYGKTPMQTFLLA